MVEAVHNLTIYEREKLEVTNVQEILSSTDKEIFVRLSSEILHVQGEDMKINKLLPEEKFLCVNGRITGINYISKLVKKSFFKRVFK